MPMKLVTIATYTFPHEMAVSRSRLEASGIECFVQDELTAQVNNFYSNAIGGVKLQVKEEDAEAAVQLLKKMDEPNLVTSNSKIQCKQCGSGNLEGKGLTGQISMVLWETLGRPVAVFSSKYHCHNCNEDHKF